MWMLLSIILISFGAWFAIARPILMARPVASQMIDDADGWLSWFWALCYRSMTVIVSYIGMLLGFLTTALDYIGQIVGDSQFQDYVKGLLGNNPKALGAVMMAFGAIVFMVRMRSIINSK